MLKPIVESPLDPAADLEMQILSIDGKIDEAARHVIDELSARFGRGARELKIYKTHPAGDCDFVFVEEGIDAFLEGACGGAPWRAHVLGCGLVFMWLRNEHRVAAPAWWLDYMRGAPRAGADAHRLSVRPAGVAANDLVWRVRLAIERIFSVPAVYEKPGLIGIPERVINDDVDASDQVWTIARGDGGRWIGQLFSGKHEVDGMAFDVDPDSEDPDVIAGILYTHAIGDLYLPGGVAACTSEACQRRRAQ